MIWWALLVVMPAEAGTGTATLAPSHAPRIEQRAEADVGSGRRARAARGKAERARRTKYRKRLRPVPEEKAESTESPEAEASRQQVRRQQPAADARLPESMLAPPASVLDEPLYEEARGWGRAIFLCFVLFVLLRMLARVVRRGADSGVAVAFLVQRVWVIFEGGVWFFVLASVILGRTGEEGPAVLATLGTLAGLLFLSSWKVVADVVAGWFIALERAFGVGDFVEVDGCAGRVLKFRTRVLCLEDQAGAQLAVPYRRVLAGARVRPGGDRRAAAVRIELPLPVGHSPREALEVARSLALTSPWGMLGESPHVELKDEAGLSMEAYAMHPDAAAELHADVLARWRDWTRPSEKTATGT